MKQTTTSTISTIFASILALTLCLASHASGLYFISGGDFRPFYLRYVVQTTEENQNIEITPGSVALLFNYKHNTQYAGPWCIKVEGQDFWHGNLDNIRCPSGILGNNNPTNVTPDRYTFANPGAHIIKVYDQLSNIYQVNFTNNNDVVSIFLDWENSPSAPYLSGNFRFSVDSCPNLKRVYMGLPTLSPNTEIKNRTFSSDMSQLPSCDEVVIAHPENFYNISGSQFLKNNLTNSLEFVNVTNIGANVIRNCRRISYVSFPKVQYIGARSIYIDESVNNMIKYNWGLKRIRIGDDLRGLGVNALYGQHFLDVIEFVTQEDDWIAAWNANTYLKILFGEASATEHIGEGALTPIPDSEVSSVYSTSGLERRPKPTKVILVRE